MTIVGLPACTWAWTWLQGTARQDDLLQARAEARSKIAAVRKELQESRDAQAQLADEVALLRAEVESLQARAKPRGKR